MIDQGNPAYGPPAPVKIIQHEAEFGPLLDLYRERRPARVLEVGTYAGGTLYHWLTNATPGALVVSVDLYADVDNSHLYDGWTPAGVAWQKIRGDSRDAWTVERARVLGPYDWVFLDAGHKEAEVRADWANYSPMVNPGGVVALHDVALAIEGRVEVHLLWADLKAQHRTHEIVDGGAGIGVVFL